ncbi:MAG: hypothetical protein WC473_00030 [Patescibacteria group bacterium]
MKIEKGPVNSVLIEAGLQEFIRNRKIQEADFPLLEELAEIPKDFLFVELHNFFNSNRERSAEELEHQLSIMEEGDKKRYFELLLCFARTYDWTACYNLVRVLERRYEK